METVNLTGTRAFSQTWRMLRESPHFVNHDEQWAEFIGLMAGRIFAVRESFYDEANRKRRVRSLL